jgi:hypothetical protein
MNDKVKLTALPKFEEQKIESNLNAVYPLWAPGPNVSIKTAKEGFKAPPIHALLLGIISLPSQQVDDDGEKQEWNALVMELKQAAYAKAPDEEEARVYAPGDRIAITVTATLEKMQQFAENPHEVLEAVLKPEVKKNKRGQNMWIFPTFGKVAVHKRSRSHAITASSVFSHLGSAPSAPSLSSGAVDGAPFARAQA